MNSRMQTNRRHPAGSNGARRRRKRRNQNQPIVWLVLVVLIVLVGFAIHTMSVVGIGTPTFYKGVNVWGVELSGYTYQEGRTLMQQMLEQWKTRSFTFTYQEKTWTLKASDLSADLNLDQSLAQAWNLGHTGGVFARKNQIRSLSSNPVYLTAEPTYDSAALDAFVESVRSEIDREAVDAEVVLTAERPELMTRSQNGSRLDTEWLRQEIVNLLKSGSHQQVVTLKVETLLPAISSNDAAGGLELVVEWSTDTSSSSKRRLQNVALALSRFNGMAVYPGQQISFNEVVGKRTVENGFNEAPEYNGTTVQTGIGGGTCQASTTMYGALLQVGFDIVQRSPHHMTVGYTKPSFDAAVNDYGSQDLVFTNNTEQVFYFYTSVDSEKATVKVYGNRPEYRVVLESVVLEKDIKSERINYEDDVNGELCWYTDEVKLHTEGKTGMRSQCYRVFYDWNSGEEIKRELVSTDYYYPQADTYYVGVHNRTEVQPSGTAGAP